MWLSKYYKTLKILLEFQNKTLSDLLQNNEAKAAEEMITKRDADLEKIVRVRISLHKETFSSLTVDLQNKKITNSTQDKWFGSRVYRKDEICHACGNIGILTGKLISVSEDRANEYEITQNINVLSTHFFCFCCDFELENHQELASIELGGQYKIEENFRPWEYFEADDVE